jgi:hypothetical protein
MKIKRKSDDFSWLMFQVVETIFYAGIFPVAGNRGRKHEASQENFEIRTQFRA